MALLPAAMVAQWVRLRPVSRSDHPTLYAERIKLQAPMPLAAIPIRTPTFEEWESTELREINKTGAAMVVEDLTGSFLGVLYIYNLNERDRRANVQLAFAVDGSSVVVLESVLLWFDFLFDVRRLRRLYVECPGSRSGLHVLASRLGFLEEVRQVGYLRFGGRYDDLVHLGLDRNAWWKQREHVVSTLTVSRSSTTQGRV